MNTGQGQGSYFNFPAIQNPNALTQLPLQNSVFVSKNGSDLMGLRNRLDRPFLTITAAKNAALSGDTIIVFAGIYQETNLLKNGVNYYFYPNAIVELIAVSTSIFSDNNTPMICTIIGDKFINTILVDNFDTPIVKTEHPDTIITFQANTLNCIDGQGSVMFYCIDGTINVNVNIINGWFWAQGGTINSIFNNISDGGYYAENSSIVTAIGNEMTGQFSVNDSEITANINKLFSTSNTLYSVNRTVIYGRDSNIRIICNYCKTGVGDLTTPQFGMIQFQGGGNSYIKINYMEGDVNSVQSLIAHNAPNGNILNVTLEGFFNHLGTAASCKIFFDDDKNVGNIFTFKNFTGRVNGGSFSFDAQTGMVDCRFESAFSNKMLNVAKINSILPGSTLYVDANV